ncbi:MAG: HlyC/CorC family transporter [Actinomycetia bacterium]|nr:HlyC/CorC family transporter [Actinomycetes bacterium]MCP3911492.1 HlyC/CorC family transporter [Actinomycetes bacterium]MCP4088144.1 HlyC/CorC family transporter [Actinomycetes bacterium]
MFASDLSVGTSLGYIGVAVVLLALNAFFVGYEFALIAARRARMESMAADGNRRARAAVGALSDLRIQLAGVQLGITMASLALGYVAEPAVGALLERAFGGLSLPEGLTVGLSFFVAYVIVVGLHLVVGEMVPKNLAITAAERSLLWMVVPYRLYLWLFRPVILALSAAADAGSRLLGVQPTDELVSARTSEEIGRIVTESREEGALPEHEAELLAGALDFPDVDVASAMVPRSRVVSVPRGATVAEIERTVVASGHSRLPVVVGNLDRVMGFVHAKDLLSLSADAQGRPVPTDLIRRMLVVRPTRPVDEVLLIMRRAQVHLAVVRDDTGGALGIVTLEDVVELLVGDITDESDQS